MGLSGAKIRVREIVMAVAISVGVTVPATNWLIRNQENEIETQLQESPAGEVITADIPGADDFELVEPNERPPFLEFVKPNGEHCRVSVNVKREPVGGKGGGWDLQVSPMPDASIICER